MLGKILKEADSSGFDTHTSNQHKQSFVGEQVNDKPKRGRKPLNIGKSVNPVAVTEFIKSTENSEQDVLIVHIPWLDDDSAADSTAVESAVSAAVSTAAENVATDKACVAKLGTESLHNKASITTQSANTASSAATVTTSSAATVTTSSASNTAPTNIHSPIRSELCWWCCAKMETNYFYLPERFRSNNYDVIGCFCTPNCAAAYNLSLKDSMVSQRIVLLNNLYCSPKGPIVPAPSRYRLACFGGELSREEFIRTTTSLSELVPTGTIQKMNNRVDLVLPSTAVDGSATVGSATVGSATVGGSAASEKGGSQKSLVLQRKKPIKSLYCSLSETFGLVESTVENV
jgi:hypothetical protein